MDKIMQYQQYIKEILNNHYYPSEHNYDEYESQLVMDLERNHYYIINVGWDHHDRIFSCMLHIDLKDEKIWIRQDWTEDGVAEEFLELGVPKEDIVLAFHAPYKRPYTGFAAA